MPNQYKATIAVIKTDHTWSKMHVNTDGANYAEMKMNAEIIVKQRLRLYERGRYPDGIIAIVVIEIATIKNSEIA